MSSLGWASMTWAVAGSMGGIRDIQLLLILLLPQPSSVDRKRKWSQEWMEVWWAAKLDMFWLTEREDANWLLCWSGYVLVLSLVASAGRISQNFLAIVLTNRNRQSPFIPPDFASMRHRLRWPNGPARKNHGWNQGNLKSTRKARWSPFLSLYFWHKLIRLDQRKMRGRWSQIQQVPIHGPWAEEGKEAN